MKIDSFEQIILTPSQGMWLYNARERIISDKVYLGRDADPSDWVEITTEEKEKIEKESERRDRSVV